jgi:hypothetical protein
MILKTYQNRIFLFTLKIYKNKNFGLKDSKNFNLCFSVLPKIKLIQNSRLVLALVSFEKLLRQKMSFSTKLITLNSKTAGKDKIYR